MTTVLLASGQDETQAQTQARTLLDLFDPETLSVHLFHAFEENPEAASAPQVGSLRRAKEILDDHDIETSFHERGGGDASHAILDAAAELDADVICVGQPRRSPTGKVLFGSVSQEVVLKADRPVLFANDESAPE